MALTSLPNRVWPDADNKFSLHHHLEWGCGAEFVRPDFVVMDFGLHTMHVTIQVPITDLRPTVDNSAPRIAAPDWMKLTAYRDFTRNFGVIEERQRGVGAVSGENLYVSARKAIRMLDGFGAHPIKIGNSNVLFECTFRRFFFDGEMAGRFEIGFALRRSSQRQLALNGQKLDVSLAIQALLDVQCKIPDLEGEVSIRNLGKHLARLWIRSTTPKQKLPKADYRYWVGRDKRQGPPPETSEDCAWAVAGDLMAIVESKPGVPLEVNSPMVKVEERYGELPGAVYYIAPSKSLRIPVWVFGWSNVDPDSGAEKSKPIRHLRLLLLRTHSDRESLWSIAKYLCRRDTPPSEDEIGRFAGLLGTRSGLLAPRSSVYASEKYGILDWKMCMLAHQIEKISTPGFEADLESMKKFFPESVVSMLEHDKRFKDLESRLNLVVIENNVDGSGPKIIVLGDVSDSTLVIADHVDNSFN